MTCFSLQTSLTLIYSYEIYLKHIAETSFRTLLNLQDGGFGKNILAKLLLRSLTYREVFTPKRLLFQNLSKFHSVKVF